MKSGSNTFVLLMGGGAPGDVSDMKSEYLPISVLKIKLKKPPIFYVSQVLKSCEVLRTLT